MAEKTLFWVTNDVRRAVWLFIFSLINPQPPYMLEELTFIVPSFWYFSNFPSGASYLVSNGTCALFHISVCNIVYFVCVVAWRDVTPVLDFIQAEEWNLKIQTDPTLKDQILGKVAHTSAECSRLGITKILHLRDAKIRRHVDPQYMSADVKALIDKVPPSALDPLYLKVCIFWFRENNWVRPKHRCFGTMKMPQDVVKTV